MDFYRFSTADDPIALERRMAEVFRLKVQPERGIRGHFLDSFDWRLYGSGRVLEEEGSGRRHRLTLRPLGSAAPLRVVQRAALPRFAADLAEGDPLRADIGASLEIRALLPWIRLSGRRKTISILDEEGKRVLRIDIERLRARSGDGRKDAVLGDWLRLAPVRGYEDWLERLESLLVEVLERHPEPLDPLLAAAAALDLSPGVYSPKLDFRLDPQERAEAAVKRICLGLLETLEVNVAGARADLDSEFLHDLRVATRRARSLLTQVKGVIEPEIAERFKDAFAWVQKITGPTRDMDVYLLAYPGYLKSLPEPVRADLAPLRNFLHSHQRRESKRLARQLGSRRFRNLLLEWRSILEGPLGEPPTAVNAPTPIGELAGARIWRMYRRVRREGRAIGADSPAAQLHELRKSCKKLRYLIEFFRSLYPPEEVGALVSRLKGLLDTLGAFQDCQVQAQQLRAYAEQMVAEGGVPPATLLAMGMLVADLLRRQAEAREGLAQRFSELDGAEGRQRFEALFAPAAPAGAQP
jgi:CHAD domain-containing protein